MTDRVIGPLRDARRPLFEGLRGLQQAAAAVLSNAPRALPVIEEALDYLHGTFLPTCRGEELTLYPAVDGVIGCVGATDIMVVQHGSIGEMVGDLDRVVEALRTNREVGPYARYLLPLLHGLYAAIRTHLDAEDVVYLSLLDEQLSESQVGMVVDNLRRMSSGRSTLS